MSSKIITGQEIAKTIRHIEPRRIAVGYLGKDWQKFLPNIDKLEAIVISPNLGTHPPAVAELVEKLSMNGQDGWDRIFLHDGLHAKVYLGQTAAVFGSANLSFNGLGSDQRRELCNVTSLPKDLEALEQFFEKVKVEAAKQYGSAPEKVSRLKTLEAETKCNPYNGDTIMAQDIEKVESDALGQFYVCWYKPEEVLIHTDATKEWSSMIGKQLNFAETDKIELNKWILCWPLNSNEKPELRKAANYFWMRTDKIVPHGADHGVYTKLVFMYRGDYKERCAAAPFKLNKLVIEAFRNAVMDDGLKKYFIQLPSIFKLEKSTEGVPKLIEAMKRKLR